MAVHHQNHLDDGDNYKSQRMQRMYRKKIFRQGGPNVSPPSQQIFPL